MLADDGPRWPEVEHLLLVRSTLPRLAPGGVVSHVLAAVLHGLPVWNATMARVQVTRDARTGGRISSRTHLHVSPLHAEDVENVDGVLVTSKARSIVDVALTLPFEQAVVVADGALADPLVGPALVAAMERAAGRTGIERARRVVAFADGRSGSAGESRSRVAIMRAGLPMPVLQWDVYSAGGLWIGCVDFGWRALRTVGEFDGRIKYGRLLKPGQDPGDVVFAEKVREDELRDPGAVRWIWSDLRNFTPVADRHRRSYQRCQA